MNSRALRVPLACAQAVWLLAFTLNASPQEHQHGPRADAPAEVPPYLSAKEAKHLPSPLPAERFADASVARGYRIAKAMPAALAQQPCFCWCSRSVGHKSLYDCFVSDHAAHCGLCLKSAFLTEKLTKDGKTPTQIRQALVKGDWAQM